MPQQEINPNIYDNGSNQEQMKLETSSADDAASCGDSPVSGRRRNSMDDDDNHNDKQNALHRAKSYGSEPYDENAEFRKRDQSVTIIISDLASSTGTAHPGETTSKLLLESPEYQGVWELYPETHIREFATYIYKYSHIEPLINNAQQLVRLLDGCKKC